MRAELIFIFLLLIPAMPAQAAAPSVTRMEQVIQSYVNTKQYMGTVLVAKDNEILLDKGYGSADLEWNIANTPDAKFRLGSITKQFTAASILLLEERGKLKITDPVNKYLTDIPKSWDKITIFNLLTHSSGIFNMTELPDFKTFKRSHLTPQQMIDLVRDKPLDFEPGEKFSYSNTGYIVLGAVIEKVSGESYAQSVNENIFSVLDMKNTGYDSEAAIIPQRAKGYQRTKDGTLRNTDFIDMSVPFSAGALYSTTHDLLTWEKGLFGGKLLSKASFQKMTTPFKGNYGFGLTINSVDGHRIINHGGAVDGFTSMLATYPDDHLTVIVLSNVPTAASGDIASKLADLAFGKNVVLTSERKEVPVDSKILARYVGRYQLAPNFVLEVTQDGANLFAQATHQPKEPIFAENETSFFFRSVEAQITFVVQCDDPASALVLHQGGRDVTANRIS